MSSTGADTQDRAATAETISPYPGLRPFERHERDFFFGRDRDAELLSNKIFASRLTLLFGQSGRGKSSLLRTLLIPQLEAEGARVFSFDEWAVPEPLSILVERLGAVLQSKEGKSVTADRAAAEPKSSGTKRRPKDGIVIDLLRRLTTYDPRPLVIVLDQFEELLLRHSSSIETARRELAALVRDRDIDLKILISLREEFLAALEPFRRDIPGLSDHPYRRLVAIIFHSFEEGESKKDAQEFLEEQWRGITVESWASRLRDGDRQVWYEMLLSYYLDNPNVDRAELLGALRDEDVFAKSKFATLPLPRRGMLCEFHFYDAIKAKSQGQRREAVGAFEAVLATGHRRYTEFALAKYLVGQEDRR
jgi:hypothetical protein